jgi:hypothetical protein
MQNTEVDCLAHPKSELSKIRVNARPEINLLDGPVTHIVELQPQAIAISWRSLDKPSAFKRYQRTMCGTFSELHPLADLGQTQAVVTLSQKVHDGDDAVKAF